jgi:Holliday junction resolvase RusA-like endonuclease
MLVVCSHDDDENSSLLDGESVRSVDCQRESVIGRPGDHLLPVMRQLSIMPLMRQSSIMPAFPANSFFLPTEVFFLPVGFFLAIGFVLVLLPLTMSVVLFRQSRSFIRNVINSNQLDIVIGRSAGGEPSIVRLTMHGEPQCLQAVRMNRSTRSWYDPLQFIKQEMKRRIRSEMRAQSENLPIFPGVTHLKVSILFVVRRDKDIDNMMKPILDVLEGIIYENDRLIYEISGRKLILNAQPVAVADNLTMVDVNITPN